MKQVEIRVEIEAIYVPLQVLNENDTLDEILAGHKEEIDAKVREYLENQVHLSKGFRYQLVEPSKPF